MSINDLEEVDDQMVRSVIERGPVEVSDLGAHPGWWRQLFSGDEAEAYAAQHGNFRRRLGERPAVLVVDVVRAFTGEQGESSSDSRAAWPTSCGTTAWEAMPAVARVIAIGTGRHWPIVYTTAMPGAAGAFGGTVKGERGALGSLMDRPGAQDIPDAIKPSPEALVLPKPKASAFFGTTLLAFLVRERVDCLVVCGTTTSGCVRATVVDGHSWGFPVFVVEEACFDRARLSHGVNLYEMDAKYADVVTIADLDALAASA